VGDVAIADLDAVDDRAVEQLAGSWVGVAIGGRAVSGEPSGGLEDGLPSVQVGGEGAATGFEGGGSLADSGLFLAEQAQVDGVGVVGRQQLAALTLQVHQFTVKLLVLVGGVALAGGDLGLEGGVQLGEPVVGELDSLVELLDLVFQPVGGDVGFAAATTAGGAGAEAVEIRVAAAVLAGGNQVGVAAAADRAVQQAFEVVVVLAFAGAAGRSGRQEVLDLLEQLGANEGLVLALN
jgi:hypothetical protein